MDATAREKWTEEAAKDKERFDRETAAYLAKKQSEGPKADDASTDAMRDTSIKVEKASVGGMDASYMEVKSEVMGDQVEVKAETTHMEVKSEASHMEVKSEVVGYKVEVSECEKRACMSFKLRSREKPF